MIGPHSSRVPNHEISEHLRNFGVTVALWPLNFIESTNRFICRFVWSTARLPFLRTPNRSMKEGGAFSH
jgi:hypothetical protein